MLISHLQPGKALYNSRKKAVLSFVRNQQPSQYTAKGTAVRERITARALDNFRWLLRTQDSIKYTYNSPDRGISAIGDNISDYLDDNYIPVFSTSSPPATIFYDTARHYLITGHPFYYREYNSNNDIINSTAGAKQYLPVYNGSGACPLLKINYKNAATGVYDPYSETYRKLVNRQSVQDSTFDIATQAPYYQQLFTYHSSGRIAIMINQRWNGTGWTTQDGATFSYNTNDQLVRIGFQSWDTSSQSMVDWGIDSMSYPAATGSYNSYKDYFRNSTTMNFYLRSEYVCNLNAAGLIDTMYIYDYTTPRELADSKTIITYTALNHIKTYNEYNEVSPGTYDNNPRFSARFYYELHGSQTNVPSVATGSWRLYPNPAGNTLVVEATGIKELTIIQLNDITGRNVLSSTLDAAKGKQMINISTLQPGIYLYRMLADGIVVGQGKVVKE